MYGASASQGGFSIYVGFLLPAVSGIYRFLKFMHLLL
jgi:hypothetical protein